MFEFPKRIAQVSYAALILLPVFLFQHAMAYTPPASTRATVNLDSSLKFIRQDATNAQTVSFGDAAWTTLNLPHTWNNLDGQDGGGMYFLYAKYGSEAIVKKEIRMY